MGRIRDRIGEIHERLTVVEFVGKDKYHTSIWRCICVCGKYIDIANYQLTRGVAKSCGCLKTEEAEVKKISWIGRVYNRLTVIEPSGTNKHGEIVLRCQCSCGKIHYVTGRALTSGNTKSCGCLQRDNRLKRQYKFREDIFDLIDNQDKAYWLGFLLADGCISRGGYTLSVSLKLSDRVHLEKLAEFMETEAPITERHRILEKTGRTYGQCEININSKHLCHSLIDIGILPRKSLHTRSIHKKLPDEFHRDYWRGIVDGDGHLGFHLGKYPHLALVGDIHVLESFVEACHKYIDFVPSIIPHGKIFVVGYNSSNAVAVSGALYEYSRVHLDRKYFTAMDFQNYHGRNL